MDISELRELISLFEEAGVSELEYEKEGTRIRLKKELNQPVSGNVCVQDVQVPVNQSVVPAEEPA